MRSAGKTVENTSTLSVGLGASNLCLVPHSGPGLIQKTLVTSWTYISRIPWIRKCVVGTVIYGTFGRLDLGLRSTSDPWKLTQLYWSITFASHSLR